MTLARLKQVVRYDPATGDFYWLDMEKRKLAKGHEKVGCIHKTLGYVMMTIDCMKFYGHRLAWFYVYGDWPSEIDHINGNRSDNRISNLRPATSTQNKANATHHFDNELGVKGIYKIKSTGRFRVRVQRSGVTVFDKCFKTIEEAKNAQLTASVEAFGEFARVPL